MRSHRLVDEDTGARRVNVDGSDTGGLKALLTSGENRFRSTDMVGVCLHVD